MPKKRYKAPSETKWASTFSDFSGMLYVAKQEMELYKPIVSLILSQDKEKLEDEYQQYLKRHYPLDKESRWEWIKSYISAWNLAHSKRDYAQNVLNRLNGISNRDKWDGTNPPVKGDQNESASK